MTPPLLPWFALVAGIAVVLVWPGRRCGLIIAGAAALLGGALLAVALLRAGVVVPGLVAENIRPVAGVFVRTAIAAFLSPTLAVLLAGAAALFTGVMAERERA